MYTYTLSDDDPRGLIRVAVSNDLMSYNCVNTVDCAFVDVFL